MTDQRWILPGIIPEPTFDEARRMLVEAMIEQQSAQQSGINQATGGVNANRSGSGCPLCQSQGVQVAPHALDDFLDNASAHCNCPGAIMRRAHRHVRHIARAMPTINIPPFIPIDAPPRGWICPRCERANAPSERTCAVCP